MHHLPAVADHRRRRHLDSGARYLEGLGAWINGCDAAVEFAVVVGRRVMLRVDSRGAAAERDGDLDVIVRAYAGDRDGGARRPVTEVELHGPGWHVGQRELTLAVSDSGDAAANDRHGNALSRHQAERTGRARHHRIAAADRA